MPLAPVIPISDLARVMLWAREGKGMPRAPKPNFIPTQLGLSRIPLPLPSSMFDAEVATLHRHFDCQHYDKCLGDIADRAWRSFTCCTCPSFPREKREMIRSFNPEVICASSDPTGEGRRTE